MSNGRGGGFFAGFLLGSIVGGAAAVLLAQEETRDLLVGKAREASNMAKDATEDLRGTRRATWPPNGSPARPICTIAGSKSSTTRVPTWAPR